MDTKKTLPLIVGLVLALLASYLVSMYIQNKEKEAIERAKQSINQYQQNQVSVFVAVKNIGFGTMVTPDMVDKTLVQRNQVHPRAIMNFSDLMNKEAAGNIPAGSQMTFDMVKQSAIDSSKANEGLSVVIPNGKRAVTVQVENIDALNPMIQPGDKVDVIAIIPIPERKDILNITLLQDVMALGVGLEYVEQQADKKPVSGIKKMLPQADKKTARGMAPVVTLALTPGEASIVYYIQERGKIKLVLRSPYDGNKLDIPPVNTEVFYQFLASRGVSMGQPSDNKKTVASDKKEVEEVATIPIYRGSKKSTMAVGN